MKYNVTLTCINSSGEPAEVPMAKGVDKMSVLSNIINILEMNPELWIQPTGIKVEFVLDCGNVGPREASSPCILPPDHLSDHTDKNGGTWLI